MVRFRSALLMVVSVAMSASVAHADGWSDDASYRDGAWETRPAIQVGALPWGSYDAFSLGALVEHGKRKGNTLYYGGYELLPQIGSMAGDGEDDDPHRALTQRLSLGFRHDLVDDRGARARHRYSLSAGVSVGLEHLRWSEGGTITRPDVVVDAEVQHTMPGRKQRYWGFSAGLRVIIAPAPDVYMNARRCSGPCADPEDPGLDIGLMYIITFPFGR